MMPHTPQHAPPHIPPHIPQTPRQFTPQHPQQHQRHPQQYYTPTRGPAQSHPAGKRFKPTPPVIPAPALVPGDPAMTIDEEEDTSRGDILDVFSPKEIATLRYMQHHEWMEEVLGSAYSIASITPVDLNLGLRGDLESVTKGLLDPPPKFHGAPPSPTTAEKKDAKQVLNEFKPRVEAKLQEMEEEMREMEKAHRERMAAIQRGSIFRVAEQELRGGLDALAIPKPAESVQSDAADSSTPPPASPALPTPAAKPVEQIVAEIEAATNRKIIPCPAVIKHTLPEEEIVKMGGVVAGVPVAHDVHMSDFKGPHEEEGTVGGLLDELNAAADGEGMMEDTIMVDFMVDDLGSRAASPGHQQQDAGGEVGQMFDMGQPTTMEGETGSLPADVPGSVDFGTGQ